MDDRLTISCSKIDIVCDGELFSENQRSGSREQADCTGVYQDVVRAVSWGCDVPVRQPDALPFYDGMLVGQDISPLNEVDVCQFTGFRIEVGHQFDKGIAEKF